MARTSSNAATEVIITLLLVETHAFRNHHCNYSGRGGASVATPLPSSLRANISALQNRRPSKLISHHKLTARKTSWHSTRRSPTSTASSYCSRADSLQRKADYTTKCSSSVRDEGSEPTECADRQGRGFSGFSRNQQSNLTELIL